MGNPIILTDRLVSEFWARVRVGKKSECWLWMGQRSRFGYGRLQNPPGNHSLFAHRVSWAVHFGNTKLCVCHKCDNPPCVNPSHLFKGTHLRNMRDMVRKGRAIKPTLRGLGNHKAKLDADKVRYIRGSDESHSSLGRKFGVAHSSIMKIRSGENWGWLS